MRIAAVVACCLAIGCGFHVPAATSAGDDGQGSGIDAPAGTGDTDAATDAMTDAQLGVAAPFALTGQHWKLPCTDNLGNNNCHCASGVLTSMVTITGAPSQHWSVNVRIRGAMEAMGYGGGSTAGGTGWYVGGTPNDGANNYYKLTISSPPQTFWINQGVPTGRRSFKYDFMATFLIDGGATATFSTSGQDGLQWGNYDQNSAPITFVGVTTSPAPYDGQFAQLDVVDAVLQ